MKAYGSTGSGGPCGGADTLVPTSPFTFHAERWRPSSPFRTEDDPSGRDDALAELRASKRLPKQRRQLLVDAARRAGATWDQIADALSISRQWAVAAYTKRRSW